MSQLELERVLSKAIHSCWKVDVSKGQGKEKISADGIFARLDKLQL